MPTPINGLFGSDTLPFVCQNCSVALCTINCKSEKDGLTIVELYFQIRLEAQRDQAQSKAGRDTGAIPKHRFF